MEITLSSPRMANVTRGSRTPARPRNTCRKCWAEGFTNGAAKRGLCPDHLEAR